MIVTGEWWERQRDVSAAVPGLPAATVRAWTASGRVRSVRVGGAVWVSMPDVLAADAQSSRRRRPRRAAAPPGA